MQAFIKQLKKHCYWDDLSQYVDLPEIQNYH
jgi:hypothetical protein